VKNVVIEGSGTSTSTTVFQTGVQVAAGAKAKITGSVIAGNFSPEAERKSVGVLLTDAETLNGGFSITGSRISGTATACSTPTRKTKQSAKALRQPPPMTIGAPPGLPVEGATPFTKVEKTPATVPPTYTYTLTGVEGISGNDAAATPAPSVNTASPLGAAPADPTVGTQSDVHRSVRSSTHSAAKPSKRCGGRTSGCCRRRLRHQVREPQGQRSRRRRHVQAPLRVHLDADGSGDRHLGSARGGRSPTVAVTS